MRMSLRSEATDQGEMLDTSDLSTPGTGSARWSGLMLRHAPDAKTAAKSERIEVTGRRATCLEHGLVHQCFCSTGHMPNV